MIRYIALFMSISILFLLSCSVTHAKKISKGWTQDGISSYYAKRFNGRKTASGERYRHTALTAAHRTLPFGTKVKVTDKSTGKSIVVEINDRGPYHGNRILDLSGGAATQLGITKQGVCDIELKVLSVPKPKDRQLPSRSDSIAKLIAVGYDINKM